MSISAPTNFPSSPFMRAFAAAVTANVPLALTGEPGVGKTSVIENSTANWGRHVETVIGSTRETTDFLGVMVEGPDGVEYKSFAWANRLNAAAKSLLLLDEFNTAGQVMKAMLRVMQERVVGETKLHDGVAIVALMNPVETSTDGSELPPAMANRMMHMDWVFDAKYWLENVGTDFTISNLPPLESLLGGDPVLNKATVSAAVTTFLRTRPNLLNPPVPRDPAEAGGAWPSPRSWTNTISILSLLDPRDEEALFLVMKGCVGAGAATEYFRWLVVEDLHNVMDVINTPSMVDWKNERPDRLFALAQGVTTLGLTQPELWKKATLVLAACAQGGKPDVALPGADKLLTNRPAGVKTIPAAVRSAFADLLSKTKHSVTLAA